MIRGKVLMARRRATCLHLACLVLSIALIVCGRALRARADDAPPPQLDGSVARGLEFLASQQVSDGSFSSTQKPAITGLALMAFLACGDTPDVGKYGANVANAIEFLLSQTHADGSLSRNDKPMYQQGIVTLALAEAYGVDPSEPRRKRITAFLNGSIKLIVAAQNVKKQEPYAGGWRYEANAPDSDMSLSGWNALALRACEDAGLPVPPEAARHAAQFVLKCYNSQAKGFAYQPGGAASAAMTGVGILCLHVLDANGAHPQATAAALSLSKRPIDDQTQFPYYAMYYAAQAANQAGDSTWPAVSSAILRKLFKTQDKDGGWPDAPSESIGIGRTYTTAMALLTLGISYRLLPVYQH
jgi:hypothetical protein